MISASAESIFNYLDDHARLSKHMTKSSWMMGGSSMSIAVDADQGKKLGSTIIMAGSVFGTSLSVEEVVCEYQAPLHKAWQTIGRPHLLVIGSYRMGFNIEPRESSSTLCVFIDYAKPDGLLGRCLGMLGSIYARWCTQAMAQDAAVHFRSTS
jgi:hypothetical protein